MKRGEVPADEAAVALSKRLRVGRPEAPDCVEPAAATPGLLDLPDLVLFELCCWLEWEDALALAATSCAARGAVLAHHRVVRVVLLELVPMVASAVASVSLRQPLAAVPARPEEDKTREPRPVGADHSCPEPDLATGAEMALDALAQQISARRHQLSIEQRRYWSDLGEADRAIVRAIRQSVVVRSHAKRGFDSNDMLVRVHMCILEVKVPTLDAAGQDTYILNILHSLSRRHQGDSDVTAQAICRRCGDPAEPSLLFGYRHSYYFGESDGSHQLDTELLNRFAKALHLPLDPQECESGDYQPNELHQFREEPLLAPLASICLDLNHPLCSPAFLRRLARWTKAWRYQLRLPQAYDLARELRSVAPGEVEQVLPHILRGKGKCIKVEHKLSCQANIRLAVPDEKGWLTLGFKLDTYNIQLLARASSESLAKRSALTYHGRFQIGRKTIWEVLKGCGFLGEVARTYGLLPSLERLRPSADSNDCDLAEKKQEERDNRLRILAVLFVCALAPTPQCSVPGSADAGDAAKRAAPFGICMLPHGSSRTSVAGNVSVKPLRQAAFLGLERIHFNAGPHRKY